MKTLKNLLPPLLALAGGIAMLFLRQSHIATLDSSGILAVGHIPGIIAGVLTLAVPALLLWRSLVFPKSSVCSFPASIVTAIGYGIGALGLAFTAVDILKNQPDTWLLLLVTSSTILSANCSSTMVAATAGISTGSSSRTILMLRASTLGVVASGIITGSTTASLTSSTIASANCSSTIVAAVAGTSTGCSSRTTL